MKIILVAPNCGENMGGEAMKAFQYFRHLLDAGADVTLVTHDRSRPHLGELERCPRILFIADGPMQNLFWRSRLLARTLDSLFHLAARRLIRERFDIGDCLIHYLCPISPYEPRFPPTGSTFVVGPLNGSPAYPPAFRRDEDLGARFGRGLSAAAQPLFRILGAEKRRAQAVLVSGGPRTETALRLTGAPPERIIHVVDSGVSDGFFGERVRHVGDNGRFFAIGRFVALKGFDMAVEAVARTPPEVGLDLIGDGPERARLEALAHRLSVADRVRFLGWRSNAETSRLIRGYRGMVFPSLREANGIVMQEAMAAGLPVLALRWAGPAALATDESTVFIEPTGREAVVEALAEAMTDLARNPERAERISREARRISEERFRWSKVTESWLEACRTPETETEAAAEVPPLRPA